jgi:hypothetical protein
MTLTVTALPGCASVRSPTREPPHLDARKCFCLKPIARSHDPGVPLRCTNRDRAGQSVPFAAPPRSGRSSMREQRSGLRASRCAPPAAGEAASAWRRMSSSCRRRRTHLLRTRVATRLPFLVTSTSPSTSTKNSCPISPSLHSTLPGGTSRSSLTRASGTSSLRERSWKSGALFSASTFVSCLNSLMHLPYLRPVAESSRGRTPIPRYASDGARAASASDPAEASVQSLTVD